MSKETGGPYYRVLATHSGGLTVLQINNRVYAISYDGQIMWRFDEEGNFGASNYIKDITATDALKRGTLETTGGSIANA